MTNPSDMLEWQATLALQVAPPRIRSSLLSDREFRIRYNLIADSDVSIGASDVTFAGSALYKAVQQVLSGAVQKKLLGRDGRRWKLTKVSLDDESPVLILARGAKRYRMQDMCTVSLDRDMRLNSFARVVDRVNLAEHEREPWRRILLDRPFTQMELYDFLEDIRDTPIGRAQLIQSDLAIGKSKISTLVPRSERYFNRLVGRYTGSRSIADYAKNEGKAMFERWSNWRSYDGFLYSLFGGVDSSMTEEIDADCLGREELLQSFAWLNKYGDTLSRMSAIEVGIRLVGRLPDLEDLLVEAIRMMQDDDQPDGGSGFFLYTNLFHLVYGEMSKVRILRNTPPFYRRLAALSQAALIHRQIMKTPVDSRQFGDWVHDNRGNEFLLQCLIDMRLYPRWDPNASHASQFREEFLGRIVNCSVRNGLHLKKTKLSYAIFSDDEGSLVTSAGPLSPFVPSPVGHEMEELIDTPDKMDKEIAVQLSASVADRSSFIALVNAATAFRVEVGRAEEAAVCLQASGYRVRNIDSKEELFSIAYGLARVAAVTRCRALTREIRRLLRVYRSGQTEFSLSVDETLIITLVASGSIREFKEWAEVVGETFTELSFGNMEKGEASMMRWFLRCMCEVIPELWIYCGRADAALAAFAE